MKKIFLSIGFNEASHNGAQPVDKVVMQYCLNSIFGHAAVHGHKVIMRDHPAITALAEAHLGHIADAMIAVPEEMDAQEIIRTQKPDIVFYLGGDAEMMADHAAFSRVNGIKQVPLLGTGGVTELIENNLSPEAREILDNGTRVDVHGFERIARALYRPRMSH